MMKRFSTSCCLITFFLLNSVMLYAQHENTSVQQWKIEDESRALQMIERADTVELIVMKGGKYDRLSDLNCFWAANDPKTLIIFLPVASGVMVSLKTIIH